MPVVPSGVSRRTHAAFVVLDDAAVAASQHDGMVRTESGESVIWYSLGKAFEKGGKAVRYGYLKFDPAVATARGMSRDQVAWNAANGAAPVAPAPVPVPAVNTPVAMVAPKISKKPAKSLATVIVVDDAGNVIYSGKVNAAAVALIEQFGA